MPKQPTVHVGGARQQRHLGELHRRLVFATGDTVAPGGLISGTFPVVQGTVGPPCGPAPAVAACPATDCGGGQPDRRRRAVPVSSHAGPAGDRRRVHVDLRRLRPATARFGVNILFGVRGPSLRDADDGAAHDRAPVTATTKAPTTTVAPVTGASAGRPLRRPRRRARRERWLPPAPAPLWGGSALMGGVLLLLGLLVLSGCSGPSQAGHGRHLANAERDRRRSRATGRSSTWRGSSGRA